MIKGFKNFLLRGDVVVIAVGLVIALAFSTMIAAFTTNIINPLVTRAQGNHAIGLGFQLGQANNNSTFLNIGALISAIIYFVVFVAVVYFVIVVPYRTIQRRRGITVFGDPPPVKTCPACLSADLPVAATRCKYCSIDLPTATDAAV
jgi:large conductance mechanosensitive channel